MALSTVAVDLNEPATASDTIRQQLNKFIALKYYLSRNGVLSTTVATLPAVARGGTPQKVKTVAETILKNAGVRGDVLDITDDLWTLTGGTIAVGKFRRYLLLVSATDVATVLASTDAATKALCEFPYLPADGLAIVGILTIENTSAVVFTPATTSLADITDTYLDGHDDDAVFRLGGKLVTV